MAANRLLGVDFGRDALLNTPMDEPFLQYWSELGRFIHEFSRTEKALQWLLRHYARTTLPVSKALFHGMRVDACKDAINRILDATENQAAKTRLEAPFAQLGAISGMRNNIVHWGASPADGSREFVVTNAFLAHTKARVQEFRVSPRTLRAMSVDLFAISLHFILEVRRSGELDETDTEFAAVLREPWLYKSPQPSPQPKAPRASPQKSQRPRGASQKSPRGA